MLTDADVLAVMLFDFRDSFGGIFCAIVTNGFCDCAIVTDRNGTGQIWNASGRHAQDRQQR